MSKLEFKPSDFDNSPHDRLRPEVCAMIANAKLNEYLAGCPLVFAISTEGVWASYEDNKPDKHDKLMGRLVNVQVIKEECPKHDVRWDKTNQCYFCNECGAELVAEWKAK